MALSDGPSTRAVCPPWWFNRAKAGQNTSSSYKSGWSKRRPAGHLWRAAASSVARGRFSIFEKQSFYVRLLNALVSIVSEAFYILIHKVLISLKPLRLVSITATATKKRTSVSISLSVLQNISLTIFSKLTY